MATNGLMIPYTGYAVMDFVIGGVCCAGQGGFDCEGRVFGPEKGVWGMNVNGKCWKALFQGAYLEMITFTSTISPEAKKATEKAFAVCRQIEEEAPSDDKVDVVQLTRQDPTEVPAYSEMILRAQVIETSKSTNFFVLIVMRSSIPGPPQ